MRDLIRNDPLFEPGPKTFGIMEVNGRLPTRALLPATTRDRVHILTQEEMVKLQLPIFQQPRR